MARILFDNTRVALAFAAVVVAGAGFIAAHFDQPGARLPNEPDRAVVKLEAEPDAGHGETIASNAPAAVPDGWYDAPAPQAGSDGLVDDTRGFDPSPERSIYAMDEDAGDESYVIIDESGPSSDYLETEEYDEDAFDEDEYRNYQYDEDD